MVATNYVEIIWGVDTDECLGTMMNEATFVGSFKYSTVEVGSATKEEATSHATIKSEKKESELLLMYKIRRCVCTRIGRILAKMDLVREVTSVLSASDDKQEIISIGRRNS